MNTPKNLLYTKDHEWVDLKENKSTIGITDYAQSQLGDIIFLELPSVGDKINAGSTLGEIEAVKTVSDIFAPISGTVLAINEKLEESPELINSDPYGEGWLIKVEISKIEGKDQLMDSLSYIEFVK